MAIKTKSTNTTVTKSTFAKASPTKAKPAKASPTKAKSAKASATKTKPVKASPKPAKTTPAKSKPATTTTVDAALVWLEKHGTKATRDGMSRYGIVAPKAYGVTVGDLRRYAKSIGIDHALADALWETGWYEARMLACFVADPAKVTRAQMDRWCSDFDNWAICDTACFHLFDKTEHAIPKVVAWATRTAEFEKRASFALLASLALHGRGTASSEFARCLPLIEAAADDERNFVKKAVSWALRGVGRRDAELHRASVELAKRLAASSDKTERWVGKDALRELTNPKIVAKISSKSR